MALNDTDDTSWMVEEPALEGQPTMTEKEHAALMLAVENDDEAALAARAGKYRQQTAQSPPVQPGSYGARMLKTASAA